MLNKYKITERNVNINYEDRVFEALFYDEDGVNRILDTRKNGTVNEDEIRASTRIVLECEKMKMLVDKILESSRGKMSKDKNKSEFSLTNIIKEIIEYLELRLKNKDLYIKERVFEPFIKYNHYNDISKEVSSSGLGLYLCSKIAKENGWILTCEIIDNNITFILKLNI